jgi:outer membrane protein TolC
MGHAQRLLTLDSCRAMALRNNKQLSVSKVKQNIAADIRRSARTKYLPHVSAIGSYEHTSEEVSILNDGQKATLGNLGTTAVGALQPGMSVLGEKLGAVGTMLGQMGLPTETFQQMSGELQQQMGQSMQQLGAGLNQEGQKIVDAFRTDTRNIWAGSILLTQPVFMGGALVALNNMADINEQMQQNTADVREQSTLYQTEQAYWQVVSLKHKQRLAEAYLDLVKKLNDDVHKMIDEGVATRSDGLTVDVKVNEAEMALTRVNDGVVLSKMLLCQTIGLPVNEQVTLADEDAENIAVVSLTPKAEVEQAQSFRPELRLLQNAIDLSQQTTNLLKAGNLPQVALTGGYAVSNPNVLNGFEKKFAGFWHVGLLMRVPVWNWGDVKYKVRASKGATTIASLELQEAREKIELQVNQVTYKVDEANKRLALAQSSVARADENLRMANVGFQEGVITPATVMEAQTAWLQAQSQKIDAEIEVKLSQVELQKALGTLR